MATYRGYTLSCNLDSVSGVQGVLDVAGDVVSDKALELKAQVQDLLSYAAADPSVPCSLTGNEIDSAVNLVNESIDEAKSKLDSTVNAINDYSDGKWDDDTNQAYIDDLLNSIPKSPSNDDENPGGVPTTNNDDVLNPSEDSVTSTSPIGLDSTDLTADEEIVIPSVDEDIVEDVTVDTSEIGDDDLSFEDSTSDDLGTRVFSSSLTVPSVKTDSVVDGINSSTAIGVGVASAMAATALAGKAFYDKKHEDDDNDDEEDDYDDDFDEEKNDNKKRFIYVDNAIDFKEKLMKEGEVDE